jgi:proline iminopeptidase
MKLTLSVFLLCGTLLISVLTGCKTKELIPGEGYVEVTGGKVWYRIDGGGNKTPILLLHGGPGSSSY